MKKIDLLSLSTRAPEEFDKNETKEKIEQLVTELEELQRLLYAESKWKILIVLQGMDASGKDGAVRKVFRSVNPQGVRVKSFKSPTKEELSHDFLWRIHEHTPENGMIQIFNRSHYEDVLITRVIGLINDKTAYRRFEYINSFEKMLEEQNTKVLKFYLHISEKEQQERFEERLEMEHKHWKFNPNDLETAKKWSEYRKVYQDVFEHCSPEIPWIIVPSDQNWYKEYTIAKTLVNTLKSLDMKYPKLEI